MGWIRGGSLILALVAVLGLVFACSSSDDTGGGGNGGAGGQDASGTSYGAGGCYACASSACSAEAAACASDPGCTTYRACIEACPVTASGTLDPACEAACPRGDGSASQALSASLSQCLSGASATCADCGGSDAGSDATTQNPVLNQQCTPITHADKCNECMWNYCCESQEAILNGGPATELANCWGACSDAACEQDCYAQHPDGIAGLGGWSACMSYHCSEADECPPSSACITCQDEHCALEYAECESDVECHLILQCINWCPNTDCAVACPNEHPAAKAKFELYMTCMGQQCVTSC